MTTNEVGAGSRPLRDLIIAGDRLLGGNGSEPFAVIASGFVYMTWADEEIDKARDENPEHSDRLFHSFLLLSPNIALERMASEYVFRLHCRELLGRVVAGTDTRPGTAAEVCCAMRDTSLRVSLNSVGAGLLLRMWEAAAGFPDLGDFTAARTHHEALHKSLIDEAEAGARSKLAVKDRVLGTIECEGVHNSECIYRARVS